MQQQTIRRVNQRENTQGILSDTKSFHARMESLTNDQFWKEVDRSIEAAGFKGSLENDNN